MRDGDKSASCIIQTYKEPREEEEEQEGKKNASLARQSVLIYHLLKLFHYQMKDLEVDIRMTLFI